MKLKLTDEGRLEGARYIASPNCDERPAGCRIELLVIHYISLPPGRFSGHAIEDFFTNRLDPRAHPFFETIAGLRASAHFLIRRNGAVIQFVPCAMRAWHAGESSWRGRPRCNDFSIGIEVEGNEMVPFTAAQYRRLAALAHVVMTRYPISEIVGHSDIAPSRKSDPGPHFDWARFRAMLGSGEGARRKAGRAGGQRRAEERKSTIARPRRRRRAPGR
ncbi:MAG: 1,6-anhydro-N-acetylmuramyl-L-alanine amidase AmpD [Burkholderiales bacterium]